MTAVEFEIWVEWYCSPGGTDDEWAAWEVIPDNDYYKRLIRYITLGPNNWWV